MRNKHFYLICMAMLTQMNFAYADKTIKMVVPYGPGGIIDSISRLVANKSSEIIEKNIIIENKPGANANIGTNYSSKLPSNGRNYLVTSSFFVTNPLIDKITWKQDDFIPVAKLASAYSAVVVGEKSKIIDFKSFLEEGKNRILTSPQAGVGTTQNMIRTMIGVSKEIQFKPIPYAAGGTSYVSDLVSGEVDFAVMPLNVATPLYTSGKVKIIAITSNERLKNFEGIPTLKELGLSAASFNTWVGIHAPKNTPPETIKEMQDVFKIALADKDIKIKLESLSAIPDFSTREDFEYFLENDKNRANIFHENYKLTQINN